MLSRNILVYRDHQAHIVLVSPQETMLAWLAVLSCWKSHQEWLFEWRGVHGLRQMTEGFPAEHYSEHQAAHDVFHCSVVQLSWVLLSSYAAPLATSCHVYSDTFLSEPLISHCRLGTRHQRRGNALLKLHRWGENLAKCMWRFQVPWWREHQCYSLDLSVVIMPIIMNNLDDLMAIVFFYLSNFYQKRLMDGLTGCLEGSCDAVVFNYQSPWNK